MSVTSNLEKVRLELTNTGYQYEIYPLRGIDDTQRKNAVSIAPPGQAAQDNILLGIQGMEADLSVNFALHDDGTDKANGTAPLGQFTDDTVVTIAEQRRWLKQFIHAPDFDAAWTLTHTTGTYFSGLEVFVERVNVPILQQDSPKWTSATIDLREGSSL